MSWHLINGVQLKKGVAVIVPIFNAPNAVRRLLSSLSHTLHSSNRIHLIFIDDASTTPSLNKTLRNFCATEHRARLIRHRVNRGFTRSVLTGLKYAPQSFDVLLLNSDTLVFDGWLEELQACAYEHPKIASVSPLTNNSLYASIVRWPLGGRISQRQALKFAKSLRRQDLAHPSFAVSSTFGFCMYIKRSALRRVGPLDPKLFPRGYGEEIDWCFRASTMGYTHRLCAKAFVFHEGSVSFSDHERKANLLKSTYLLAFKAPEQFRSFNRQSRDPALKTWITTIREGLGRVR